MLILTRKSEELEDRTSDGCTTPDRSHSLPESIGSSGKINLENSAMNRDDSKSRSEEGERNRLQQADLLHQIETLKKNEEILSNEIRNIVAKERKLSKINSALREKEINWKMREDRLEQEIWLLKKMVVLHSSEKRLASMSTVENSEVSSAAASIRQCHSLSPIATPKIPNSPPGNGGHFSARRNSAFVRPNPAGISPPSSLSSTESPRVVIEHVKPGGDTERSKERNKEREKEWEKERELLKEKCKERETKIR
jgi:hypothetical protein